MIGPIKAFRATRAFVRIVQDPTRLDEVFVLGTVEGIDVNGGLRVRVVGGELRTFHSGDVSLRAAHGKIS